MDRHSHPITVAVLLIVCIICNGSVNSQTYSISGKYPVNTSDIITKDPRSLYAIYASAKPNNTLLVKYNLALKRVSTEYYPIYENCEENVELRTGNISLVPDIWHFVRADIVVGSCDGFCLNVYKNRTRFDTKSNRYLRDGIRISKDSVLSIVVQPQLIANASVELDNITVSHTVQFLNAITANLTLRVEATKDETKWNETHFLLQIPELYLVSKVGLRARKYRSGGWIESCRDQMTLLALVEMDTPTPEETTQDQPTSQDQPRDLLSAGVIVIIAISVILVVALALVLYFRSSLIEWFHGRSHDWDYNANLVASPEVSSC